MKTNPKTEKRTPKNLFIKNHYPFKKSGKGVFCGIKHSRWLIEANFPDTEVSQNIVQLLALVSEHYSAVMRETTLDEHVAVKSSHFLYGEHAYCAEGT